jgi:hypothetical protein
VEPHQFDLPSYNQISHSGGPVQWSEFLAASGSKKEKREKLEWFLISGGQFGKKGTGECLKAKKDIIFNSSLLSRMISSYF